MLKGLNGKTTALLCALICEGCAGASPNPVAVVQPQDRYMTCDAIFIEVKGSFEVAGVK